MQEWLKSSKKASKNLQRQEPYAPKPYKFIGSMEKPRVSEGNPRFSKPVLKYGFSTGMYGLNMGLVRVKYGFSTV